MNRLNKSLDLYDLPTMDRSRYYNQDGSTNQLLEDFDEYYQSLQLNQIYPLPSDLFIQPPLQQQNYLSIHQYSYPTQRYGSSFCPFMNCICPFPLSHDNDQNKHILDGPEATKKKSKSKKRKNKIIDPNAPQKPKRKTGLSKPVILSSVLSNLMDGAKELSRPEIVQKLWKYIKENGLQDPLDRRFILCDDKLKKVFQQDRINSFAMNKDLSAHLTVKQSISHLQTHFE